MRLGSPFIHELYWHAFVLLCPDLSGGLNRQNRAWCLSDDPLGKSSAQQARQARSLTRHHDSVGMLLLRRSHDFSSSLAESYEGIDSYRLKNVRVDLLV